MAEPAATVQTHEPVGPASAPDCTALFEEVVQQLGPAIMRMLPGYESDAARRDDLRQEILVALWRALPNFRGASSLRTFGFRVAHNTALRHRRDRARWRHRQPERDESPPAPSVHDRVEQRQTLARIHGHIRALPAPDRQLLLLYLEGLPTAEIADVTGLSRTNVTTRLSRLRTRLAQSATDTPPSGAAR